jgi:hypothetical protein
MCKIAHNDFFDAKPQQPFREKNSSRKYAIVRLRENFALSRMHSDLVIQQGAEEKLQSVPYSLDSYLKSSFSIPEIKSPGSPTPAIFASNSTSTAAPFPPIFFKPRQACAC